MLKMISILGIALAGNTHAATASVEETAEVEINERKRAVTTVIEEHQKAEALHQLAMETLAESEADTTAKRTALNLIFQSKLKGTQYEDQGFSIDTVENAQKASDHFQTLMTEILKIAADVAHPAPSTSPTDAIEDAKKEAVFAPSTSPTDAIEDAKKEAVL